MATEIKKLNLGAGNDIIPHSINHDLTEFRDEIDITHDLNVLPWPWPDERFKEVIAKSVLEHLHHDLVVSLNEIWRILKPGGLVTLKLPHWRADVSWWDPTHRWKFSLMSFEQFDPNTERGRIYAHYSPYKWKMIKRPHLNKAASSIHLVLQKVAGDEVD